MSSLPYMTVQCDWQEALRGNDGQAWITCKLTGQTSHHGDLHTVGLSSNGIPYVSASEGFHVISVNKNKLLVSHQDPNCKTAFYSPNAVFQNIHLKSIVSLDVSEGGLGVSVCTQNKLLIWDVDRGIVRRELSGHVGDVYTCRFFPSGVVVLSGGADMQLKIWSAETGQCPVTLIGHVGAVLDTAIVEKGRNIISVSRDGSAKLWDCGKSNCLATLIQLDQPINGCHLSSGDLSGLCAISSQTPENVREVGTNGKLVLLACEDKHLRAVCVASRQNIFSYSTQSAVNACCFLNNLQAVCGCQDGQLALVDLRNTKYPLTTWLHSAAAVLSLLSYNNGFVCSKTDGTCLFYTNKQDDNWQLTGPDCDPVYKVVHAANYTYTCCRDGIIRKYQTSS